MLIIEQSDEKWFCRWKFIILMKIYHSAEVYHWLIWGLLIDPINFALLTLCFSWLFSYFPGWAGGGWGWGKSRLKTISAQLKLKLGLSLAKMLLVSGSCTAPWYGIHKYINAFLIGKVLRVPQRNSIYEKTFMEWMASIKCQMIALMYDSLPKKRRWNNCQKHF